MENPNKLLLKAVYNQVVKAISELCHLYFLIKHGKIVKGYSFMFHKSLGQCLIFYFHPLLIHIYLKTHSYFSIIWNFKINIITKNGNF